MIAELLDWLVTKLNIKTNRVIPNISLEKKYKLLFSEFAFLCHVIFILVVLQFCSCLF
jgi:hypothetical protein